MILFVYGILSSVRLNAGIRGNRIESTSDMIMFIFFTVFAVSSNVYFIQFQTYILKIEAIIHLIAVGFICFELLLSVWCIIIFRSLNKA
mmetsp:Transcript_22515/g.30910  ORF Transcript_22515/g.30910 Transcript_22515/m.30910 type:complete len:89 (+) Transcript_22515:235-501(+)